ncbi:carbohydrate ABC transporter permease [Streptomyces sp. NPDC056773]|uniref:carbohydrate ABC transporter permease n=1 Tax=unclassified Streptomyces TaxID=2593676 RepID=UPI003699BA69
MTPVTTERGPRPTTAGTVRSGGRTPRRTVDPRTPKRTARRVERRWAMLFATPYLAHLALLTAWPLLALAYLGFTDYDTVSSPRWTGLDNYARLLGDEAFWTSMLNTGYFALIFVPLQTVVALALAVGLNQKLRGIPLLRGAYFVPVVSSWVVMAYVADAVFNPRLGSANTVLDWFGIDPQNWLDSPVLVIPTLALIAVWKGAGYMMVLFLAALQAIPEERYEAARVDGAGAWGRFRHITVPGVSGTTFLVLVLSTITTLQAFEQVFVMTGGGPGDSSELTVLYMYRQGFEYFQMGYAAAIAWVLFAVILLLTLVQLRLQKRWVHYA